MVFPAVMYACESWTVKKAECRRIDAFELWCWRRLLRESLGLQGDPNQSILKEISPSGRADVEAEAPMLWPPDGKNWLTGKDPDAEKDWRQKEKGTREDKMVGWHHWLDGHEFEQAPGVGDGQGSLACCSPWCLKDLDMTEWLNWAETGLLLLLLSYRRQWHPTAVLLPGKSHGWRSLVVHGVAKSQTRLSDFTFTFHFHALEKEMATHSSVLAWRIPWMEKPGRLQSMGSQRVGHNWSDAAAADNIIVNVFRYTSLCTFYYFLIKSA